jgi:hypothetical protein
MGHPVASLVEESKSGVLAAQGQWRTCGAGPSTSLRFAQDDRAVEDRGKKPVRYGFVIFL